MATTVVEELPLIRGKVGGSYAVPATGPNVGPGSYNIDYRALANESRAPFNTTSERPPLSTNDPTVPGPGAYTEPTIEAGRGITACPFVSGVSRFPVARNEDVPGPGTYNIASRWPTKKIPRAHQFAFGNERFNHTSGLDNDPASSPGYYSPNYYAADRKNPKAAFFAKYSGRNAAPVPDVPGPGTYNITERPRSLYDTKPSSMFATNTARTDMASKDTPGPGSYSIASGVGNNRGRGGAEMFSGFGSSASRFANKTDDSPGPGAYTGDVAPRRAKPQIGNGNGTAPFASLSDRFGAAEVTPGPGTYDGRLLPKHLNFGAETPFMSTVKRFGPTSIHVRPELFDEWTFSQTDPNLRLRSGGAMRRPFYGGEIHPTLGPKPLPERVYDVRYDWPKPECTAPTTFGAAPRLAATVNSGVPGPGYYGAPSGAKSRQFGGSNWPRDVRLKQRVATENGLGGGLCNYESTFFTKSHNVTIGGDTMWMD